METLVADQRQHGIALSTLGFGQGNYNDEMAERLADVGDGNHAYIDTALEAQRVLVQQMGGTLHTIARDVKVQVEFNPAQVAEYRLITRTACCAARISPTTRWMRGTSVRATKSPRYTRSRRWAAVPTV